MTVRVTKPSFNLRDKLAELQRPIGATGAALMKSETPEDAFNILGAGRRNIVINGDMRIDQRNNGSSTTLSTNGEAYGCDRFLVEQGGITGNTGAVQQVTDAPDGFSHSIKYTSGAVTFNDNAGWSALNHRIEGTNLHGLKWGTINAEYVTLSFWVKSSYTGTFSLNLTHYDGSTEKWNLQEYTIQNKNVWEYKTLTFAPDRTHSIGESGWMRLYWHLITNFSAGSASASNGSIANLNTHQIGAGGNRASVRSVCLNRSIGETFFLTGVQLEIGRTATPFEYRSYGEELELCKRYWYIITTAGASGIAQGYVIKDADTNRRLQIFHKPRMRAVPTVTATWNTGSPGVSAQTVDGLYVYVTGNTTSAEATLTSFYANAEL